MKETVSVFQELFGAITFERYQYLTTQAVMYHTPYAIVNVILFGFHIVWISKYRYSILRGSFLVEGILC